MGKDGKNTWLDSRMRIGNFQPQLVMESPEIYTRNNRIMRFRAKWSRKAIADSFGMTIDAVNKVIERRLAEADKLGATVRFNQKRVKEDLYDRWIKITDVKYYSFEEIGGCYVFYSDGKPFYVGQSSNVSRRIGGHRLTQSFDGTYYTPWGDKKNIYVKVKYHKRFGEWLSCEARLIKKLKTKYNRRGYEYSH